MSRPEIDELLWQLDIDPQPTVEAVRELIRQHRRGLHKKEASEKVACLCLTYLADFCRVAAEVVLGPLLYGPTTTLLPATDR